MSINTMPEGFAELLQYLNEEPEKAYKASEIQSTLRSRHQFTSGKITGIITRAAEQGVIVKTSRSIYKLRSAKQNNALTVIALCKAELNSCISRIEGFVGQKFSEMSDEELEEMKRILRKLKELAG